MIQTNIWNDIFLQAQALEENKDQAIDLIFDAIDNYLISSQCQDLEEISRIFAVATEMNPPLPIFLSIGILTITLPAGLEIQGRRQLAEKIAAVVVPKRIEPLLRGLVTEKDLEELIEKYE